MKDKEYNFVNRLPGIVDCKKIFKASAILDAILMPEWEYRYYSFNSSWNVDEQMASMRNGQGDHYFALFNNYGLIIKGYDKECEINDEKNLNQIFSGVPEKLADFLTEPAFVLEETTFCLWNQYDNEKWIAGKDYTEKEYNLLQILAGPESYHSWASQYYEINLELTLVRRIFEFEPLDDSLIKLLNEDLRMSDIKDDLEEIGYPYY